MNKNKLKKEKGITLVALIITIIVLLILAVVAINAVQDGGIIEHAKDAQTKYSTAQVKEEVQLGVNGWLVENAEDSTKTLENYLKNKYGQSNINKIGEEFIVTVNEIPVRVTSSNNVSELSEISAEEFNALINVDIDKPSHYDSELDALEEKINNINNYYSTTHNIIINKNGEFVTSNDTWHVSSVEKDINNYITKINISIQYGGKT